MTDDNPDPEATPRADRDGYVSRTVEIQQVVHGDKYEIHGTVGAVGRHARAVGSDPAVAGRPFWNVPNRNPYFTGREELLDRLETRLRSAGEAVLAQAITGLGGVGKTQTAIEFCHRHRDAYAGGVFWTTATSSEALAAELAGLAMELDLVALGARTESAAKVFRRHLSSHDDWLLVLDNADSADDLRSQLPESSSGQILVTTRRRDDVFGPPLDVEVLDAAEAVTLLSKRAQRDGESEDARRLVEELGYLPLAIEQAGSYLATHRVELATYLDSFRERRLELLKKGRPKQGNYQATVSTTWQISFAAVEAESQASAAALRACAFLAAEGIPLELLEPLSRPEPGIWRRVREAFRGSKVSVSDPLEVHETVVEPLTRYSLASYDESTRTLSVHRLVQEVIRTELDSSGGTSRVLERVHRALDACFPWNLKDPKFWPDADRLLLHIQSEVTHWRAEAGADQLASGLWSGAGEYAMAVGRFGIAKALFEADLKACERVKGPEDEATIAAMNNLALILGSVGDLSGARQLQERVVEICRRVFGPEHRSTLVSISNLALTLHGLGELGTARDLLQIELATSRRVLGPEHDATLQSMNNLALSLGSLGEYSAARELQEKVLKCFRRDHGAKHPTTLGAMNNLAQTLYYLGDYSAARELQEMALSGDLEVLGPDHPSTLQAMNNLSLILSSLGDFSAARELQESTLTRYHRVLGPEHPDTLLQMNNLAVTLYSLRDFVAAREVQESLLETSRRALGPEHPLTLMVMANLADTMSQQGESTEARALHESALEIRRDVLGAEHPDTLRAMNSLTLVHVQLGDFFTALDLQQAALESLSRVLGPEHPDTLRAMSGLAAVRSHLGDFHEAFELQQATVELSRQVLGSGHPETVRRMNDLALVRFLMGDLPEALELQETALESARRALGPEHPDTLLAILGLIKIQKASPGTEVDPALVAELESRARDLPEGSTLRKAISTRNTLRQQLRSPAPEP